jgi:hypothetical protein
VCSSDLELVVAEAEFAESVAGAGVFGEYGVEIGDGVVNGA